VSNNNLFVRLTRGLWLRRLWGTCQRPPRLEQFYFWFNLE